MSVERTLAIIKPDAVNAGTAGKILARIEQAGFKVLGLKMIRMSFDDAARSLIVLGLPGTKVRFFNDQSYRDSPAGSWSVEIPAVIDFGNPLAVLPFVVVPDIPAFDVPDRRANERV